MLVLLLKASEQKEEQPMSGASRRRYPSDLTEFKWQLLARILPPPSHKGRHRSTDLRDVLNAINYRWQTNCSWRMLPHDFPAWQTVYTYYQHWLKLGLIGVVRDVILSNNPDSALQLRQKQCASVAQVVENPSHRQHDLTA